MLSASEETEQVLQHHLQAFDQGDMDGVMSDYAENAVLLTPKGPKQGHAEIREVLEWMARSIFTPDCKFQMIQQLVEDEIAFIVWAAESHQCRIPLATDTFLVRNGKIVIQTFAAKVEEKQ